MEKIQNNLHHFLSSKLISKIEKKFHFKNIQEIFCENSSELSPPPCLSRLKHPKRVREVCGICVCGVCVAWCTRMKERESTRPKESPSSLSLSSPLPSPAPSPSSPPVAYTFTRLDGVDWPWWANTWFFIGSILWVLAPILLWMDDDHEANVTTLLAATCFVIDGFFYFGDWYYAKKDRLRRTGNTCRRASSLSHCAFMNMGRREEV